MVEWLAGNRIRGTNSERINGTSEIPAVSGGWKELGRTTSSGSTITVSSLPDKRYYMFLYDATAQASGGSDNNWRFNGDTGSNYAHRKQVNGASDSTGTGQTRIYNMESGGSRHEFGLFYLSNLDSKEKLMAGHNVINWTSGAGGEVGRKEIVGKWVNTADALNAIQLYYSSGSATSGEVVVLGWDPDDTHTDNFWEELASVDLSGGSADVLDSGTFTAKKYLWIQAFMEQDGGIISGVLNFNNDTGSNYARRRSSNGGSDGTETSHTSIDIRGGDPQNRFENLFIINNASKEKLVIGNMMVTTAGAGNAPNRTEYVAKWANTSNQITSVKWTNGDAGSYGTSSIIKVWGHD